MTAPAGSGERPLRIALFTYSTKPRGGVIHTLALAEHLQALGHYVHIYALGKDQTGFFRPTTVPFTLIPFGVLPDDISLDERIKRYIESYRDYLVANPAGRFDVYHVQDCVSANAVWRVREEGHIPAFVRTIHHVDDFTSPALIQCQNDSIHRPNWRIVVSRYWQERLQAEYGVESEVIYNGVDLQRFHPPSAEQRRAARAELEVGDDALVILHIGGIEPRKNTLLLYRAFERARQELGRPCVLLLPGGETLLDHTPYRQEFMAALEASALEPGRDYRLMGAVPDELVPRLYHAADLLAFPSVKEGWGLVVLEAMASALPVLTSDLPVFREYLRDEDNALLVDPLDEGAIAAGMVRLGRDGELGRRLAEAGIATARQYSWEDAARAHVAHYRRWLSGQQGR